MRRSAPPRFLALAILACVIGACSSGSGAVRTHPPPTPRAQPPPAPAEPPPVPAPPVPPPAPDVCIPTHAGTCLADADFRIAVEALAERHRSRRGFANQWGLSHVRADYAYGHLGQLRGEAVAPGAGVTIGFIDSGIDRDHPDFAGNTVTEQFLAGAVDETGAERFSHGTAVASVAAAVGSAHERSAHGVAWGADIAMFAIPTGQQEGDYAPVSPAELAAADELWAGWLNQVFGWREDTRTVAILNLSVGYNGIIDSYSEQELRSSFAAALAALAQESAAEKTILVWAAGNAHGDSCDPAATEQCVDHRVDAVSVEVLPGLVARIAELQGHSIAVVALNPAGRIADFSNRCGLAAAHCIAAPGEDVRVAYFGPAGGNPLRGNRDVRGTSVAAPFVAGGLALMKQLFRDQLSNTELVTRLLETADDAGEYADRAVYGRGALDLRAATWPVGVLDVPAGGSPAHGRGSALLATRFRAGRALGDGLERSLAGHEIAAFDTLGAPFWFHLDDFANAATAGGVAADWHRFPAAAPAPASLAGGGTPVPPGRPAAAGPTAPAPWRVGLLETPFGARGGHLALAERAVALTLTDHHTLTGSAFTTEGGGPRPPASGAALWWRPGGAALGLQLGWVHERETLLGSSAAGAFGRLEAASAFAGISAQAEAGAWKMGADVEVGGVGPSARDGIITALSPITTSAFALQAVRSFAGAGTVHLSLSQPLRVERGRARLSVPAGRTKEGVVLRSPIAAELEPSGRQLELAAQWRQPLAVGELRLGFLVTHQHGHRASADPELTLLSGWRWSY